MELKLQSTIIPDKRARNFYAKPKHGKLHIYNRGYYFTNSTAFSHSNDLMEIIYERPERPNIIALVCDNGSDFSPTNYLVIIALGRLWRTFNLDQLFALSFAPYHSKYNMI